MGMLGEAESLLSALNSARASLTSRRTEDAYKAIESAKPALGRFLIASKLVEHDASAILKKLQERTDGLTSTIKDIRAGLSTLSPKLQALTEHLSGDRVSLKTESDLLNERKTELATIRGELAAHEAKLKKLKKWCWVPGYGAYLAIDALVEKDIGAYRSSIARINTTDKSVRALEAEVKTLKASIVSYQSKVSKAATASREMQSALDQANLGLSIAQARSSYIASFNKHVGALSSIADHIEKHDVPRLTEALDRVLNLDQDPNSELVTRRTSQFEKGLITLAMAIDTDIDFLVFNPVAGTEVLIKNTALYVATCQVVKVGDDSVVGPPTNRLAVLQHAVVNFAVQGFRAGDVVRIKMDVQLGPTTWSAPILVVEERGRIVRSARMRGSVFDAAIEIMH